MSNASGHLGRYLTYRRSPVDLPHNHLATVIDNDSSISSFKRWPGVAVHARRQGPLHTAAPLVCPQRSIGGTQPRMSSVLKPSATMPTNRRDRDPGAADAGGLPHDLVIDAHTLEHCRAVRWENGRTGKSGWSPAVLGGWPNSQRADREVPSATSGPRSAPHAPLASGGW